MRTLDLIGDAFGRVHELVPVILDGLDSDDVRWRPDPAANPIGWLCWHLARAEDGQLAPLAGLNPVWTGGWQQRFALPYPPDVTGFGQSAEEVGRFAVEPELILGYAAAVAEQSRRVLAGLTDDDLERVVDSNWNPPVTLGVRLVSVLSDITQHAGQAAYVKGLRERATDRDSGWRGYPQ